MYPLRTVRTRPIYHCGNVVHMYGLPPHPRRVDEVSQSVVSGRSLPSVVVVVVVVLLPSTMAGGMMMAARVEPDLVHHHPHRWTYTSAQYLAEVMS